MCLFKYLLAFIQLWIYLLVCYLFICLYRFAIISCAGWLPTQPPTHSAPTYPPHPPRPPIPRASGKGQDPKRRGRGPKKLGACESLFHGWETLFHNSQPPTQSSVRRRSPCRCKGCWKALMLVMQECCRCW